MDGDRLVDRHHWYSAVACWGWRPEPAEALATRWLSFVARLQTIDPAFARWMHWENNDTTRVPFEPTLPAQTARILAATERHVSGRLVPEAGARVSNYTDTLQLSRYIAISMDGGKFGPYVTRNYANFGTSYFAVPEAHLVGFAVFRQVVLALAEVFEATQAYARPDDLRDLRDKERGDDLPLAWISYVAPRFAGLVMPPPGVVVEHRPDGGLLMAATVETFRTADPAHLAAARAIYAALQPFNAVPWTPEAGK